MVPTHPHIGLVQALGSHCVYEGVDSDLSEKHLIIFGFLKVHEILKVISRVLGIINLIFLTFFGCSDLKNHLSIYFLFFKEIHSYAIAKVMLGCKYQGSRV